MSELADETDSKSVIRKGVWVRVPPPAVENLQYSVFIKKFDKRLGLDKKKLVGKCSRAFVLFTELKKAKAAPLTWSSLPISIFIIQYSIVDPILQRRRMYLQIHLKYHSNLPYLHILYHHRPYTSQAPTYQQAYPL